MDRVACCFIHLGFWQPALQMLHDCDLFGMHITKGLLYHSEKPGLGKSGFMMSRQIDFVLCGAPHRLDNPPCADSLRSYYTRKL